MPQLLTHEPEGDRNPYESVPWSRTPIEPSTDDTFQVGVRTADDVHDVIVEWRTTDQSGRTPTVRADDSHVATLGPFQGDCEYRFTVPGGPEPASTTEWFTAPITRWTPMAFTAVTSDEEGIHATSTHGRLTLNPATPTTLRWTLDSQTRQPSPTTTAKIADWTATLDAGRLVLSRDGSQLILSADAAHRNEQLSEWRLTWALDPNEQILGTGERFDALDQRRRTPDMRVYEQYKGQGSRTYFPVPWLISTRGYALAIDSDTRISFDLGATNRDLATATIPADTASGTFHFGTPKEVIQAYVSDIGLPTPMPDWAYGPWMSGNEWDSDRRIREVVNQTVDEDIPATVVVIEAWSDESTFYLFNDATYDTVPGADPVPANAITYQGKWPDPKQLVDWLHAQHIRVLLWQIPVLKDTEEHQQQLADVAYADDTGLCVGTSAGESYRNRGWWFPGSRIIDFTNPEARAWWFNKRAYLLDDIGIDGFKTDGGEHLWGTDVCTFDGATGHEAANNYPTHYLGAYHHFMNERGHAQPLTFSRAGFTGSQSFPAHWAGDEDSTWDAYRASLTAGLSAGISGVAFWGWDLAGFSRDLPTAELYKRATAMAAFCPIMQYHSEHNEHREPLADRTPWNIADHTDDPDVTSTYRFYARLRMNLIPYLLSLGADATRTGIPLMRAMVVEYPDDPTAAAIDDQFLLGSDILVAPVLEPGITERAVYLPDGEWSDFWSGAPVETGWITAAAPVDIVPAYVRRGASIPLWMPDTIKLGASVGLPSSGTGRLVLMVSPGTGSSTILTPGTGEPWTTSINLDGSMLTIHADGAPTDVTAWIREPTASDRIRDHYIRIPEGNSTINVDLANHDT